MMSFARPLQELSIHGFSFFLSITVDEIISNICIEIGSKLENSWQLTSFDLEDIDPRSSKLHQSEFTMGPIYTPYFVILAFTWADISRGGGKPDRNRCAIRIGALFNERQRKLSNHHVTQVGNVPAGRFVYKELLKQLQFKRVASLTEAGQKYSEYISLLHDMLQASGVTFVSNRKFPSDTTNMAPVSSPATPPTWRRYVPQRHYQHGAGKFPSDTTNMAPVSSPATLPTWRR